MIKHEKQQRKISSTANKADKALLNKAGTLLRRREALLSARATSRLEALLVRFDELKMVYDYRQSLQQIWLKTATSQKELIDALQQWCKQAEESGVEVLRQFSEQLKSYVPQAQAA
jgi:stearoyl-CoA desaturase (delta-9 desaturase)